MTDEEKTDEHLKKYGLTPDAIFLDEIRNLTLQEISNDNREGNEFLKLCCLQLFFIGDVADSLLIWKAKRSDFDAYCYIDIQFVCGAGLSETKKFLLKQNSSEAIDLLAYLIDCEKTGDFEGFSIESQMKIYKQYFYGNS